MSLRPVALTDGDKTLVVTALRVIAANYEKGRHHIGAAVRMRDEGVFAGIHIEARVGRVTLCAEAVALGTALSAGARDIETVVAVAHPGPHDTATEVRVVSPCGMCRELISDFGPEAWVILSAGASGATKVSVHDLLPAKYTRGE